MTTANLDAAADVINLATGCTYTLTGAADVSVASAGGVGLPIITQPLTINGNGSTITRSSATSFRILFISAAAPISLTLNDLTVSGGSPTAGNVGGGLAVFGGASATLNNVTLSGNAASSGGGVWQQGGNLTVNNSTFSANTANGNTQTFPNYSGGGAIYATAVTNIAIDHTAVTNNVATFAAGGVFTVASTATVTRSSLVGNTAASVGAAFLLGGTATYENDTFSANRATNAISGLAAFNLSASVGATVNVSSSTFADSGAATGTTIATSLYSAVVIAGSTTKMNVTNTIVADTDSTTVTTAPCQAIGGGTIVSTGANIEYPTTTAACGFSLHTNPLLAAIALNGGLTQNFRPLAGSPALNAGGVTCPATDQRDKLRPAFVSCDIGSFEVQAPDTTATGPSGTTNSTTTTATGTGDGPLTFACSVDSAAFATCTSPFTPVLADGAHTIAIRTVDSYGQVDTTPPSFSFTLDKTNPVVTITSSPPAITSNNSPSIAFTATDGSGSGVTGTTCKIDSGSAVPCTSPFSTGTLADGTHTVTVAATDAAGNTGSATTTAFKVDTVASQTFNVGCAGTTGDVPGLISAVTAANATLASDTINLTAGCTYTLTNSVETTNNGDGLPIVVHPLRINGNGATITRSSSATTTFRILFAFNNIDAADSLDLHNLTISGGSLTLGNVGAGIASLGAALSLDHVTLLSNIASGQTAGAVLAAGGGIWTSGGTLSVDHSVFQTNSAPNAGALEVNNTPTTVKRTSFVLNGATSSIGTAWIIGSDATFENDTLAANSSANGIAGITVSNLGATNGNLTLRSSTIADSTKTGSTAPASALLPFLQTGTGTATISVTNSIVTDTDSTAAAVATPCSTAFGGTITNGGGNVEYPGNTCGFATHGVDPLLNAYSLTTNSYLPKPTSPVIDLGVAANCPATDQNDKVRPDGDGCDVGSIETNAPETTATNASASEPTNAPKVTFASPDQTPATFQCKVDAGAFAVCTSPFSPAGLTNGSHTVQVRAFDPAGYFDPSPASVTFTVDITAPTVTITNKPPAVTPNNSPSLNFTVNDGTAVTTCQVDSNPAAPCATPFAPGTLGDGPHTLKVFATDPAGNVGSDSATFTVDTAPPQTFNVACGDVTGLRAAITAANATLAPDTIEIATASPCTFTLSDSVDATAGGNGLPVVYHPLTINGHGATIARNTASGTPAFRILLAYNLVDAANSLTLHDLTIASGSLTGANVGAGLVSIGSAITITGSTFSGNATTGQAGALWTSGGTLSVDRTLFFFNAAPIAAGLETTLTPTTVTRSAFVGNAASNTIGAAWIIGGAATFENNTFAANSAASGLAGLTVSNSGTTDGVASVRSSTFVDQTKTGSTAPANALLTYIPSGTGTAKLDITNTVVTDTDSIAAAVATPCGSLGGTITSSGGNVEYPGNTCGFATHGIDPQLNAFSFTTDAYLPKPTSPLIDQAVAANCPATDQAGKTRPDGDGCDIGSIETNAPETTSITGPSSDPTNTPTVSATSDQTPALFQCSIDGGAFAICPSPFTVPTSVPDGLHTVRMRAVDSLGYFDPSPQSVTFTIDRTAPTVSITNKPPAVTPNNSPSLNFTVNDATATTTCQVDSNAPVPCSTPFVPGTLGDGSHTLKVFATDPAGNVGSDSATFTVDTAPPQILNVACGDVTGLRAAITAANATLAPDTIEIATASPCTFTLNDSVDPTSGGNGLPIIIHPLTINGHGATIARNTASGTPQFRIMFVSNQVDSGVSLDLHDLAINSGLVTTATPSGVNVGGGLVSLGSATTLDHVNLIGDGALQGGAIWTSGGTLKLDHSGVLANSAVIAGGIQANATPLTITRSSISLNSATSSVGAIEQIGSTGLYENDTFGANQAPNGAAGLSVTNSAAVNGSATVRSSTLVDSTRTGNTAPASALLTFQSAGTGTAHIDVTNSIVSDTDSQAAPVQLKPCDSSLGGTISDLGGNTEFPGNTCSFPNHGTDPLLNAFSFTTFAYLPKPASPVIDHAIGASCPATDEFDKTRPDGDGCDIGSIETNAPETTSITGPSSDPTNTPTVSATSDQTPALFQCNIDGGAFASCPSPFTVPTSVPDGMHTVSMRAVDSLGYFDPSPLSVTFTIDRTAPTVAITNKPAAITATNSFALAFTVNDANATVTCQIDGGPVVSDCTSPFSTGTLADGSHTVTVSATDTVGNTGTDSATFVVDTVPSTAVDVPCGDVGALRAAITAANATLAPDTINVTGGPCTFTLNDVADPSSGGNGLPIVVHPLRINGNGATIARNTASGTPAFRVLFAYNIIDPANRLELHDLTITGGSVTGANVGGGIAAVGSALVMDDVAIIGNVASQGGGVWTSQGSLDVDHSQFFFNFATAAGGLETTLTPTTIRRSLFELNSGSSSVGAALIIGGTATFENDTFAVNVAGNGIGGIAVENSGSTNGVVNVASSTFADSTKTTSPANTAPASSLLTFQGTGTGTAAIHVTDTIVTDTDSTATPLQFAPCDTSLGGTITDDGGNLEYPGNTCGFATHGVDPKLGAFGLNGSLTSNYALQAGSPAIDLGGSTCPATDQRDKIRPDGAGCDAGAYEVETPPVVTITSAPPAPPAATAVNNPSIGFTVDDATATVTCQVDSSPVVSPCSSPFSTGTLADGTHTVTVTATDPAGNAGTASATFKVDTVASTSVDVACGNVTALRAAITAANATLAPDTINVTGGPCTFTLNDSVDPAGGGNGLPIVVHPLTINGNGSTIARNTGNANASPPVPAAPNFRILFVANSVDPASRLELHNLTISGGSVASPNVGGGIAAFNSALVMDGVTVTGNVAAQGGGVWTSAGSLDIDHSSFIFNFATVAGGLETTLTPTTVRRSLFFENDGISSVGAALVIGGTATFENDTFSLNIAPNGAAGLAVENSGATNGVANVSSSTFADSTKTTSPANTAPASSLLTLQAAGTGTAAIHVTDTIVTDTDSTATPLQFAPCDTSLGGTITDDGGNLEYPGNTCHFATHGVDPKLAALANNGGPTFTYRLLPTSPAIDLGGTTCPATDQRNNTRPDPGTACDTGAYEVDAPDTTATGPTAPTSTPVITFTSDHSPSTFQCSVDGGAFAACSSPYTPTFATNGSGDGSHTVKVRAIDSAGYVDPSPASVTFTYFSVPDTTITSGPTGGTTVYDANVTYTFTSTKSPSTFQCALDAGPFAACTSPKTQTVAEGAHTFRVRSIDAGGHVDPTPATATFTYHRCLITRITINGIVICLI